MIPEPDEEPNLSVPIEELLEGIDPDAFDDLFGDPNTHRPDAELIDGGAVNWRELEDSDAPETWAELRDWVQWLTNRYELGARTIPDCWYRHGGVVEELSALHTAWKASFSSADSGYGPIGWHERLFVCEQRLTKRYEGICGSGHQDPYGRRAAEDDEFWAKWVTTSHA